MKINTNIHKIYEALSTSHPKLTRGQVWCHSCGKTKKVDSEKSLRDGWAKCCGYTMSLDSPAEREKNL